MSYVLEFSPFIADVLGINEHTPFIFHSSCAWYQRAHATYLLTLGQLEKSSSLSLIRKKSCGKRENGEVTTGDNEDGKEGEPGVYVIEKCYQGQRHERIAGYRGERNWKKNVGSLYHLFLDDIASGLYTSLY